MNISMFDILGPIMIGPSSSHTAGAVRLGRVANKVLNQEAPKEVMVELSGSFAKTYRGHGTDRALLAGIMGYHSYSEEIRDIFPLPIKRHHLSFCAHPDSGQSSQYSPHPRQGRQRHPGCGPRGQHRRRQYPC